MAAASGDDADIFGFHAEPPLVAVNLFHLRNGRIVDRREFFWEDQTEFNPPEFFSSLLLQIYLDQQYIPGIIHVPVDFEDREAMEELLSEKRNRKVEIHTPQRGQKKAMLELAAAQRQAQFRRAVPRAEAVLRGHSGQPCRRRLDLPDPPKRIECFDISHIQGTDKVASMVVWEDGRMKKAGLSQIHHPHRGRQRRFRQHAGGRDAPLPAAAGGRHAVARPGLIDGGLGQLHAAAGALEAIGIINQPLAAIAKREEIIYVLGQENDPIVLDRFSPILHLIQTIRDEAHRFAVTFHRTRRNARTSDFGTGPRFPASARLRYGSC